MSLPEQAATRVGVTLGAIEAAARRHGRDDVLDRIARRERRLAYAHSRQHHCRRGEEPMSTETDPTTSSSSRPTRSTAPDTRTTRRSASTPSSASGRTGATDSRRPEDHPGDSEEGYYPDDDEQEFHGVLHPALRLELDRPLRGCVVQSADWETPDDLPRDAPYGRYDIDVEWGEPGDGPVLYLIAPTTPGRHTP